MNSDLIRIRRASADTANRNDLLRGSKAGAKWWQLSICPKRT